MTETKTKVAYFCMEYGLNEKLPLYAGGLGILAGDYLKAAQKISAPVTGIGIWWKQDYTHQYINEEGYPYDTFPVNENSDHLQETGHHIRVDIGGHAVICDIYRVTSFDNAPLLLLDMRNPHPELGWINNKLYTGEGKKRIAQEIILGVGGIRALRELNIEVDKYHFNEGHAAFAGFELIRETMSRDKIGFNSALKKIKEKIVFTTHTPVPAGNETHNLDLVKNMGGNCGLEMNHVKNIGGEPFNMTAACLRMASIANGVSQIHQTTARKMWEGLSKSAPIIAVTNGVHRETWQAKEIREKKENPSQLWKTHMSLKKELVAYIADNTPAQMNEENLIIGFARRAAPYKRSELIFRDTEKIEEYLHKGKIQLVFSGKAHPDDHYGKDIVARLVKMDKKYQDSIVFLENYDMEIARYLIRGCDVWLNNPRRPLEASGTSGMKVALNGGLNLSVLDGWVAEGIEHGVNGWILDELFTEYGENLKQDEKDLRALYSLLKNEVIPTYYNDREQWINMMKASIKMAEDQFTAQRMIEEYYNKMYNQKVAVFSNK